MGRRDPSIGIAFGGGGAKGLSQIGVLKVLGKYGISPSRVVGTSAGSIIAGSYALGLSAEEILERITHGVASKKLTRLRNFGILSESLIKDSIVKKGLREIVGDATFEDLKIPFSATTVDLESGQEVIINSGLLWEAMRASASLPFIISPYFIQGRYLVDGGLLDDVPVEHLRGKNGVDIVVGVEMGGMTSKQYISAMIWEKYYRKPKTFHYYPSLYTRWRKSKALMVHVMLRSLDILREHQLSARYKTAEPDIIIRPQLDNVSLLDFSKYEEAIDAGIIATEKVIPDLLTLIQQKKDGIVEGT